MSKYETTIEKNDEEIEIEVEFDFQPAERMTHDYPGCDAEVEINSVVTSEGQEIELEKDEEERMVEEIMDYVKFANEENDDYRRNYKS